MNLGFAFNNLIPVGNYNIVPAINLYYFQPAGDAVFTDGSVYDFSLSYSRPITQKLDVSVALNAGYHYRVFDVEDWGYTVASTVFKYKLNNELALNISANYQNTLNEGVNSENELWGGIGIAYAL